MILISGNVICFKRSKSRKNVYNFDVTSLTRLWATRFYKVFKLLHGKNDFAKRSTILLD